jgi:hypothetical protein
MFTFTSCSLFFTVLLTFFIMLTFFHHAHFFFSSCSLFPFFTIFSFSSYLALGSVQQNISGNETGSNRKSTRGASRLSKSKFKKTKRSSPRSDGSESHLFEPDQPRNLKIQPKISKFFTNSKKSKASPTNSTSSKQHELSIL